MLSTDATKFSKKEGDSIGKGGKDLAKRHVQSTRWHSISEFETHGSK